MRYDFKGIDGPVIKFKDLQEGDVFVHATMFSEGDILNSFDDLTKITLFMKTYSVGDEDVNAVGLLSGFKFYKQDDCPVIKVNKVFEVRQEQ